ncbi:hypothetical protein [Actinoalloteichus sp. GBA129-24]|uniref:hypothetical protein n=1 Tax=Actinoalloteichus sp. GBA129-24 TaxID=1612551 RepID=UPI000950817B|nr:hypothetical protein UA75_16645 [Actinoalloteichus sp. GBA129-24]
MADFEIRPSGKPVPEAERTAILASPGFGTTFTDHMVTLRWSAEHGWHDGRLEPYGPFTLAPATSVFHYAQACFEGMKAYRQANGAIALFRPEENAARFNRSAERMAMPALPAPVLSDAEVALQSRKCDLVVQYYGAYLIVTEGTLREESRFHFGCFQKPYSGGAVQAIFG